MLIQRIAIIFDDQVRPDTTGVYSWSALRQLAHVEHFSPTAALKLRAGDFDLFLVIDDGLDYELPAHLQPMVVWAIDTHLDPGRIIRRSQNASAAFAAQRNGVQILRNAGIHCIGWLPLACDPDVHRPHHLAKDLDVSFVGNLNCPERADALTEIRGRFPRTFVGQMAFEDMARQYSRSKIVFNHSIRDDVNMRVFEALACGSLLVTNDLSGNGQSELFRDKQHLVTYNTVAELLEKLKYYLEHNDASESIAQAGLAEVLEKHTYAHRMAELLWKVEHELRFRRPRVTPSAAQERAGFTKGLTSIVVLTHNQLRYTRQCLESVRDRTDSPFELIVVDNASSDGTCRYVRSLGGVRLIENKTNEGFAKGANQGIGAAVGEYIVLLNNDTIVTTGWLGRLLNALADPTIALAGPCSNRVSGAQQIKPGYTNVGEVEAFAEQWASQHESERKAVDRLVGFCLCFRSSLIGEIGLLDEQFGIGNFEDDDLCLRARQAGYKAVIARDAFVHHFGSRTFRGSGISRVHWLEKNRKLFAAKWATLGVPGAPVVRNRLLSPSSSPQGVTPPPRCLSTPVIPRLSLCMIVRDNAKTLPECLKSISQWVDEMIVVDTGSCDQTPAIARSLGAKVFEFPWCDDFAAARNESLRHATGEWIFWMDSDDTIDSSCGQQLRTLADQFHPPNVLGFVIQVHCPGEADSGVNETTVVDHIKLVRNHPDLRFEGRIHEQILPSIRRAGGEVRWTNLFVVHSGADRTAAGRSRKLERDLRLLRMELADHPDHTFALFNLGMTLADAGDHAAAVTVLLRSLETSSPAESHVRKIYALLAASYLELGQNADALEICNRGLVSCANDVELSFRRGLILHRDGHLEEAILSYQSILSGTHPRQFSSVDDGLAGYKARHNLAVLFMQTGSYALAEEQWRRILAERPSYRPAWSGLTEALRAQGRNLDAASELSSAAAMVALGVHGLCLRAELAAAVGDTQGAIRLIRQALIQDSVDAELLARGCALLFGLGDTEAAEGWLAKLVLLTPEDPAAHHNLAAASLSNGKPHAAVKHCRQSLALRPKHDPTIALLRESETQLAHLTVTSA